MKPIVTNAAVDKPAVATSRAPLPANAADIFEAIFPKCFIKHCETFDTRPLIPFCAIFSPASDTPLAAAFLKHFFAISSKNPDTIWITLPTPFLEAVSATFSTDSVATFPFAPFAAAETISSALLATIPFASCKAAIPISSLILVAASGIASANKSRLLVPISIELDATLLPNFDLNPFFTLPNTSPSFVVLAFSSNADPNKSTPFVSSPRPNLPATDGSTLFHTVLAPLPTAFPTVFAAFPTVVPTAFAPLATLIPF